MKALSITFILCVFTVFTFAQNPKFEKAMMAGVEKLQTAEDIEGYQAAANHFERIANAEKKEWLPAYYHAYCHMMMAAISMNKKLMGDCKNHLDVAEASLMKANEIDDKQSEVYALMGFVYQGRIWEDPMSKGAEFSPLSHEVLDQAIELDPNNPRAYYLKGQNVFYTPEFWGGGAKNALPLLEKAAKLYTDEEEEGTLMPTWGKEYNQQLLEKATKTAESSN